MRPLIALLLISLLATGGCDRQSRTPEQANRTASAPQAAAQAPPASGIDRSHKGEAAPATSFTDPSGKPVTVASFRGKPVLLNLWATWCAPCVREMPSLDALAAREGDALRVITVSQDMDGAAKTGPFFAEHRFVRLGQYLDPDMRLSLGFGSNLPTTILYDSRGREVWRAAGAMDWTSESTRALLAEAD